jgi:hypothetical protein
MESAAIRITVHDALGREVAVLADGSYRAGDHILRWGLEERSGEPVPPGVYWVRLRATGAMGTEPVHVVR